MAATAPQKSRAWVWILVVAAIVLAAYFAFGNSHAGVEIRTAQVDREDLVSTVSTNGKVEPVQDFQAHAANPSTVTALLVHVGQHVVRGQELVRLNPADAQSRIAQAEAGAAAGRLALQNMEHGGTSAEIASNRSEIAAAEVEAQSAAANLRTVENLQAEGAASNGEVAQAREKATETTTHVAALKSQAASRYTPSDIATQKTANAANYSALAAAESNYSGVDIRSPFAGTVYSVSVAPSEYVPGPQESLVNVANLSHLQIRAYFDEPEIGKLAAGQPVKIVWDAEPGRVWNGYVVQPPSTIITYNETRNVGECIISIDNPAGLLPNTNVVVTVTTSRENDVLSLPREALHTLGMEDFVFRVVDGRLVKTDVKAIIPNLTRMEIVSGLKQGDTVALGPLQPINLINGMKVKPQQ